MRDCCALLRDYFVDFRVWNHLFLLSEWGTMDHCLFLATNRMFLGVTKKNKVESDNKINQTIKAFCYRPQRSCVKVMFLHLSVILFTGGVSVQKWGSLSRGSLSGRPSYSYVRQYASYLNAFLFYKVPLRLVLKA